MTAMENIEHNASESQPAPLAAYVGIFVCTAGLLMLEILLTRILSFTIWYHLAYLAISTALLSFGAAGSILATFPGLLKRPRRIAGWTATAAGISMLVGMMYLAPRPVDPATLFDEPTAFFFGLMKYYLVLSVPFFLGGIAIAVPLAAYPANVNRLYAVDLAGAAVGCSAAVAALTWTNGPEALGWAALTMVCAGIFYTDLKRLRILFAAVAIAIGLQLSSANEWLEFRPAASKGLGLSIDRGDHETLYTQWSPVNRVDVSRNEKAIPGGFWGMGVNKWYKGGRLPGVMNVRYDGHNGSNIYEITTPTSMAFLDYHILRTPYVFLDEPRALIIGVGGGIDVHNALRRNASHVTAAELQPITVRVLKEYYADYCGQVFNRPDVNLVAAEGRHFVRSSDAEYDLVQITATDTFSAQATGAYVLAESYLYTVEAFQDYFDHLSDDGILCVVLGDIEYEDPALPSPLASRLVLTARQALWEQGVEEPSDHILIVSPLSTSYFSTRSVLVVKKSAFTPEDMAKAEAFTEGIDLTFRVAPGKPGHAAMTELARVKQDDLDELLDEQEFHLAAATDARPFFYHILRWRSLFTDTDALWYVPGSSTGQIMLLMMLGQAVFIGGALILLPLFVRSRRALESGPAWRFLPYFLALGIGFMLIEISFVQKYALFLGYPTYSLSVTIVSLLVFAAIGAALSTFGWGNPRRLLMMLLTFEALFILVEIFVMPSVRASLLGLPLSTRIALTILFQCPLGICLGMFFPTGVELVRQTSPGLVPWAWAVNGIGSVAGTVLAVIIAMAFGFSVVVLIAVAIYVLGALPLIIGLSRDNTAKAST